MNYPLITEYIEAIKSPEDNFEELKHLRPILDCHGEPVMTSGNFAVVFKMKDEQTDKLHAVTFIAYVAFMLFLNFYYYIK